MLKLTFRILPQIFAKNVYFFTTSALKLKTHNNNRIFANPYHIHITRLLSIDAAAHGEFKSESSEEQKDEIDFNGITEGDPDSERLLKVMILEVDICRQDGHLVPDKLTTNEWRELLSLQSKHARLRYLKFLFKNEKREENRLMKIVERRRQREENYQLDEESGHITYGFRGSTIFLRIYDSTIDAYLNKNLINAAMFSQHLVFDCSYDRHMNNIEARNAAKQICMLFADNRNHQQPFHLRFCNINPSSVMMQSLQRYMPTIYEETYPFFTSTKSYLDLYPKEKLVYLTPHCKESLQEYNHDDVYIIGAMVDKTNPKPLSLAKAKEEGIRMARLPLEKHLVWGAGATKNLTLNQMVSILLDLRQTNDWNIAFKHIPRRKVVSDEYLREEGSKQTSKWQKVAISALNSSKDVHLSSNVIRKLGTKKRQF